MSRNQINILLADDDNDDCLFFKEALEDLQINASLAMVHDGEELMQLLNNPNTNLPTVLFLDLNIPRKNGIECLTEINLNKRFEKLPIIIISTSFEEEKVKWLHQNGPIYYIRKPPDFLKLKNVLRQAVSILSENDLTHPTFQNFILTGEINKPD